MPEFGSGFSAEEQQIIHNGYREFSRLIHRNDIASSTVRIIRSQDTYFDNKTGELFWNPKEKELGVIHELGHWLEKQKPSDAQSAVDFLLRRTAGNPPRLLKEKYPISAYTTELYLPDEFAEAYIGRLYRHPDGKYFATEITAHGLEMILDKPYQLIQADPEHFQFIYNIQYSGHFYGVITP